MARYISHKQANTRAMLGGPLVVTAFVACIWGVSQLRGGSSAAQARDFAGNARDTSAAVVPDTTPRDTVPVQSLQRRIRGNPIL